MPKPRHTNLRRPHASHLIALLCALLAALALSACGGSASPSSEQAAERESETKLADFARCMREHGIQVEVANVPGGGRGLKIGGGASGPKKPGMMEAAQKACAKYRPKPKKLNLSPQEKVQREEAVLKFAKCMREHGIEVHASASEGAIQVQIHGHPGSGPNPESPAFQSAQNACQGYLSKIGGDKFPHGAPPPGGGRGATEGSHGSGASLSIRPAGG